MIKRLFISTILFVLLALPLAGCADTLNIKLDPISAHNLKEMSVKAEVVVLGRFQKGYTKYNGARDPHDPKKPSKNVYSEARSYKFAVDKTLKGNVPSNIRINLLYNKQIDGLVRKGKPIKVTIPSPSFFEPDPSKTYLLFLKKSRDVAGYSAAFQPYAIAFDATGKAKLIKPRSDITSDITVDAVDTGEQVEVSKIKVYTDTDTYTDSVSGQSMDQILRQVESYVK